MTFDPGIRPLIQTNAVGRSRSAMGWLAPTWGLRQAGQLSRLLPVPGQPQRDGEEDYAGYPCSQGCGDSAWQAVLPSVKVAPARTPADAAASPAVCGAR